MRLLKATRSISGHPAKSSDSSSERFIAVGVCHKELVYFLVDLLK